MLWTKVELQGPPPACRLDFGMCQVSLFRSLTRVTDDQDLVTQVQQTKEILDRELKPGSASSRDSRQDTGSGTVQYAKKSWLLLFQTGSYFNDWSYILSISVCWLPGTKLSVKADQWKIVSSFILLVKLSHIVQRKLMPSQSYGPLIWNFSSEFILVLFS